MSPGKVLSWTVLSCLVCLVAVTFIILSTTPCPPPPPARAGSSDDRVLDRVVEVNPSARLADFGRGFVPRLRSAASREGLPVELVLGLIEVESGWDPRAVSPRGAVGLMQVMPDTAAPVAAALGLAWRPPTPCGRTPGCAGRYASLGTLGDPDANVAVGTRYLGDLVRRLGLAPVALRAYNRGEGRAHRRWPGDRYADGVGLAVLRYLEPPR